MSVVAISYSGLRNASSEATGVSRKLNSYANSLENSVYRKLNRYDGECPQNIREASNKVKDKVNMLRERADSYNQYATDLSELRTECQNTDKAVRGMVSNLTASFKESHGIKNNVVLNFINYHLTGVKNSSNLGRWINDRRTKNEQTLEYVKETIEDRWDYEGGKELIQGAGVAILEIVAGVASIVVAVASIISGGWTIALVAGLIGGVLATINGVTNLINEGRAFASTQRGDPATGRRLSKQNTIQETIRNEVEENMAFWYGLANGIDILGLACTIVTLADGAVKLLKNVGNLFKNAYKWTTNSGVDIKNLKIRNILTGDNIKAFGSKVKLSIVKGKEELGRAIRFKEFENIKKFAIEYVDDFKNCLGNSFKNTYWNFVGDSKVNVVKNSANSIKSLANFSKAIIKDGFDIKNLVYNTGIQSFNFVMTNITIAKVKNDNTGKMDFIKNGDLFSIQLNNNKLDWNFLNLNKVFKNGGSIVDNILNINNKFENMNRGAKINLDFNNIISKDNLLEKMSQKSNINIAIPKVYIPNINIRSNQWNFAV